MLYETLKTLRKQKGYSQEEAAARLNVVRQTVSKWEKGLSVPDADMLVKLAELYEVGVSDLLGAPPADTPQEASSELSREIADQLARINEQLVIRNRRARRILKGVLYGLIAGLVLMMLSVFVFMTYRVDLSESGTINVEESVFQIDTILPDN